jgi:hypothetical protein
MANVREEITPRWCMNEREEALPPRRWDNGREEKAAPQWRV